MKLKSLITNQIVRRCVPNSEIGGILAFRHSGACGGISLQRIPQQNSYNVVFIGPPFLRMHLSIIACESCQKFGGSDSEE